MRNGSALRGSSALDGIEAHVPGESMHSGARGECKVRSCPIEWHRTVWRVGISLADLVVFLRIQCRIDRGNGVAARVRANDFSTRVHDLELPRAGIRAE